MGFCARLPNPPNIVDDDPLEAALSPPLPLLPPVEAGFLRKSKSPPPAEAGAGAAEEALEKPEKAEKAPGPS